MEKEIKISRIKIINKYMGIISFIVNTLAGAILIYGVGKIETLIVVGIVALVNYAHGLSVNK